MRIVKFYFTLILLFINLFYATAQSSTWIDSLRTSYTTAQSDEEKLHILKKLSCETKYVDFESSLIYGNKGIELAKKMKQYGIEAEIHNCLGLAYSDQKSFQKALIHYSNAEELFNELNNKEMIGVVYNNLGLMYNYQNDYAQELGYHQKALDIFNELNLPSRKAMSYINIGKVYAYKQDYKIANDYFLKAYDIYNELNDYKKVVTCLNNIAAIYQFNKEYELSYFYFQKNLELLETMNMDRSKAMVLYNMSAPLMSLKRYEEAEQKLFEALEIARRINDKTSISICYHNLANLYIEQKKFNEAKKYYEMSLEISIQIKMKDLEQENYKNLSAMYQQMGDYENALTNHLKYTAVKDSIFDEQIKKVGEVEKKYLEEKSAREIEVMQIEKQKKEYQSNVVKTISVAVILLMGLLIFFISSKYKSKQKSNLLLAEKNKEITASITYAKRIQNAILPSSKIVKEYLPDNFILYIPKDIIAGDFYWLESVSVIANEERLKQSANNEKIASSESLHSQNRNDAILFAAADCTGHGVPGAMVSVVCNNALNRSVREYGLTNPSEILNKTREIVVQEFEKSDDDVKDGMDISLCSLDFKNQTLQWCGANNPLWIVRKNELIEIKPNKQPIGKVDNPQPFTTHTIELQKEDTIYIFTDGFADQFGGPKGKKLMYKPFKELLLSIHDKTMGEQKIVLEQHFENWKGSLEQVDDVCIIGVNI